MAEVTMTGMYITDTGMPFGLENTKLLRIVDMGQPVGCPRLSVSARRATLLNSTPGPGERGGKVRVGKGSSCDYSACPIMAIIGGIHHGSSLVYNPTTWFRGAQCMR